MVRSLTYVTAFFLAMAASSCGSADADYRVQFAPGFVRERASVSVLGVYKDGRMSTSYWEKLGPKLSAVLGGKSCDAFFSERLNAEDPKLFSRIEKDAKEEGITQDLVSVVAPHARGEAIMVVNVYGRLPVQSKKDTSAGPQPNFGGGMQGRGRMGGHNSPPQTPKDDNALVMQADLMSVETREVVGRIALRYTGTDGEDAIAKFMQQIRMELPSCTCTGWK
jgi:hypothetical protein